MSGRAGRLGRRGGLAVGAVGLVLLFLLAVRLLGAATELASPEVEGLVVGTTSGNASALGLGWLAAYGLANGSVVAAVSVSLFAAGTVGPGALFYLVAGSRLGGAGVVVLLGALDYLHHRRPLATSTGLGTLTFLLALTVYLPATLLGGVLLAWLAPVFDGLAGEPGAGPPAAGFEPATARVAEALGAGPALALALGLLVASLWGFDALLGRVRTAAVRRRVATALANPRRGFLAGVVITSLSTSVAFSLGLLVPLYNRGYVERDEVVPFVLGANVGTLADTLVVGLVVESPAAVAVVLLLAGTAVAVTLGLLATLGSYRRAVGELHDRLLEDRRWFLAAAVLLLALPVGLVVLG